MTRLLTLLAVILAAVAGAGAAAQDVNVALAANGTTIRADSEWMNSPSDRGGVAPAARLIDGIVRQGSEDVGLNRWHSELSAPHPHWVWLRFPRPARIHRVVLWRADVGSPTDFAGQTSVDRYHSLRTLFSRKDVVFDAQHPSCAAEFAPVVTDNFRLLITRSSNKDFPNYTQASELQVFGEWAGPAVHRRAVPAARSLRGPMLDAPLPRFLSQKATDASVTYTSPWLKVGFQLDRPGIGFLALDAAGSGRLTRNLIKPDASPVALALGWDGGGTSATAPFTVSRLGNVIRYDGVRLGDLETVDLAFAVRPKGLTVTIDRQVPDGYLVADEAPFRLTFDAAVTPPSPLGRLKRLSELAFPVFLHFPDHGSLLVRAAGDDASWGFVGRRGAREVELSLRSGQIRGDDATVRMTPGRRRVSLEMQMVQVYPDRARVDADSRLAGLKRGWLNIFQFRPDVACLSNNSVSDNCMFCLYEYADQAYFTPPLFHGFTALDAVRQTLDAYFSGTFGYGGDRAVFVDTDPALVIAAWDYAAGRGDRAWLKRHVGDVERFADHIVAADVDGDGLAESVRKGNSGLGINGAGEWSSNWWDVISFGWKDAYGNALDYRAFRCLADLERRLGRTQQAARYRQRADRIRQVYYSTFFDPATGVLAGWRSQDGQLHDYYFTFVSGIAVSYGLVTREQGNAIMDRMQEKMRQVGYTAFRFGLPGNLIPVMRKDYAGGGVLGQPGKDDGSDSFQNYENGAATGSFAYFYLQGLYALGRTAEADRIFDGMLQGYRDGVFQNGAGSGVDWKRWDGTPCGYEGLLTDTYYALTAYMTGRLGRGVPMP
jgi:hypothetical protein